ncbi:HEPN domain-containing protein, partial [Candidatus Gottesmanbacteria bacterium]|nr:HEPN domain-containing protein [Candidatus Gottesmanbacteria bacterium]
IEHKNARPPKTHRIEDLFAEAGLDLAEIDSPPVVEFSRAYIRVRYPDLNKQYFRTKDRAEPLIQMGRKVYLWVQKKFKNL